MKLVEVEAILGNCPDYDGPDPDGNSYGTWEDSGRMIVVSFSNDRVFWTHYVKFSAWERIERWYIRLMPRKWEDA